MNRAHVAICQDCGWHGTATTRGHAEHAHRRHSCEKQRRLDAARERGRARTNAVDRTPKPCRHVRVRHRHGTRACYVLDECRCRPCADANAADEAHRKRQSAYGRWQPYVDADPIRAHVESLRAQGMGSKRVAAAAGLASSTVWQLVYGKPGRGPAKRVRVETAAAILAVRLDVADGALVEALSTVRRLQALVAAGWTQTEIAHRIGWSVANLNPLVLGNAGPFVVAATARAVDDLYRRLAHDTPPRRGIRYAHRAAQRHGWAPPAAWDEDTIADPLAHPNLAGFDETVVQQWLATGERPEKADRLDEAEVVRRLREYGFGHHRIRLLTGIEPTDHRRTA